MISVILPTIRPERVGRAYRSIERAGAEIEIIVVTTPEYGQVVRQTIKQSAVSHCVLTQEPQGTVAAINLGFDFDAAYGTSVFIMNDESTLEPGSLNLMLELLRRNPDAIIEPIHEPAFNFAYYGLRFAPFPLVRKSTLKKIHGEEGIYLDPIYKCFYADPDLSLKAHREGVEIITAPKPAVVYHNQDHDLKHYENISKYLEQDRKTFRERWDHLGVFQDPG